LELGLTEEQFMDLTPYEFSLLYFHYLDKTKTDYEILRNVIYNAGLNLLRKKGQKIVPLFDENGEVNNELNEEEIRNEREELFGKKS
jgi:hypothetical protein